MSQGETMALKIRLLACLRRCACGTAACCICAAERARPAWKSVAVTGSRVISDAANSPTPLTIVSTDDLRATAPASLPDGLNKLPVFQGSQSISRPGDGSQNFASSTLNLRNFGAQRTLVLLDGHRATPVQRRRHGGYRHPAAGADHAGWMSSPAAPPPCTAPTR